MFFLSSIWKLNSPVDRSVVLCKLNMKLVDEFSAQRRPSHSKLQLGWKTNDDGHNLDSGGTGDVL